MALPTTIDKKLGISPRATMISAAAMDAVKKPTAHTPSAGCRRCWSQETSSRQPATAGVKTTIANDVVEFGTSAQYQETHYRSVNPFYGIWRRNAIQS
jgi:hypothetical protein